jgi:PLP dependent protein
MTTIASLKDRYTDVRQRIARAAQRVGRSENSIVLVAVTKTAEPDQIRELIRMGHADFAENRVQQLIQRAAVVDEWLGRQRTLPGVHRAGLDDLFSSARPQPAPMGSAGVGSSGASPVVRWHMIGHLQRNKARKVVELCRLIHSVDSLRLAEELQAIAFKKDQPVEVLLQVNCTGEEQKYGCAIAAAQHLAEQIETMVHVKLRGLMTMAAHSDNPEHSRFAFARCRELFHDIRDSGVVTPAFNVLSMGMSNDFEIAIEEGANIVRVGSALFGEARPGTEDPDEDDDADD